MDEMSRYFVLGLKFRGVSRTEFERHFGMSPEAQFGQTIDRLLKEGLLCNEGDYISLTPLGVKYVNNVSKEFYTDINLGWRQHLQFVPTISPDRVRAIVKQRDRRELQSLHVLQ